MVLIESLALIYFIYRYFSYKKFDSIILSIIIIIENLILNFDNKLLYIILFITLFIFILYENKKILFNTLFLTMILLGVLVLCKSISIVLISLIFNVSIIFVMNYKFYMIISSLMSIYSTLTIDYLLFRVLKNEEDDIVIKDYWLIVLFIVIVFMMLVSILDALISKTYSSKLLSNLFIEVILLCIISLFLYYKIYKQNKANIKNKEELIKKEYYYKIYQQTINHNDQVNKDKHMMIYNMVKIKMLLLSKNYQEIEDFTNKEINKLSNYKYICSTGNYSFDYKMTNIINELKNSKNIKTTINITKNNKVINKEENVNNIINIIYKISNGSKNIDILIKEKQNYIIITIIVDSLDIVDFKDININKLEINKDSKYTEYRILLF